MKEVRYTNEARKQLLRLPTNIAHRLDEKLHQYAADPQSLGNNIKALQGAHQLLRLRVGDWRIIFRDDGLVLNVQKIAPRGSAYDRMR